MLKNIHTKVKSPGLRALAALAEEMDLVASTHMVANYHL